MGKGNGVPEERFDEAARYYRNAKEHLGKAVVRDRVYVDLKPVREACGTLWLAVLEAVNGALLQRGVLRKALPKSYEQAVQALGKHLAVKNGRLLHTFNIAYDQIHVAGHYRGLLGEPEAVKGAFLLARRVIETLSGRKIG